MTQAQKTDLREAIALAIGAEIQALWADENAPLGYGGGYQRIADAVLAIARPAIIEECAKVAESMRDIYNEEDHAHMANACNGVAKFLRALAEKP